eukprot:TRINITY_DN964_c0_g1_i5.p1 TRINITY_DN964_c0_g1~~TRINITY_DN964_c0_g1_i5.p1  ORF type:complete len:105 (+),score=9.69 TRINITY_DN964_c0_g1_i5:313-627(+)
MFRVTILKLIFACPSEDTRTASLPSPSDRNLKLTNSGGVPENHEANPWTQEDAIGVNKCIRLLYLPGETGRCILPYPQIVSFPELLMYETLRISWGHPNALVLL